MKGRGTLEPTEAEFQTWIIQLARLLGWTRIVHFRSARTGAGWRTPIEGDSGFPDLILIRGETLLAVELKSGGRKPSAEQVAWLQAFKGVPGCHGLVWTTRDPPSEIEAVLRTA